MMLDGVREFQQQERLQSDDVALEMTTKISHERSSTIGSIEQTDLEKPKSALISLDAFLHIWDLNFCCRDA